MYLPVGREFLAEGIASVKSSVLYESSEKPTRTKERNLRLKFLYLYGAFSQRNTDHLLYVTQNVKSFDYKYLSLTG